jgi:hypothetical protein
MQQPSLEKRTKGRRLFNKTFMKEAEKAKYQMAFGWGKEVRVAPNAINRSPIFGCVKRGRRRYLQKESLATIGETSITFSGLQLDQADKDAWYELLHRARAGLKDSEATEPFVEVRFSVRDFLRSIGRSEGGGSQKWLEASLERLMSARINIEYKQMQYKGVLLLRQIVNMDTKEVVLHLDRQISTLFLSKTITKVGWRLRLSLSKDFTKWMYDYIMTHQAPPKNPHRIGLEKLYRMSHASTQELTTDHLRDFRARVRGCMKILEEEGVVERYEVQRNILYLVRT